MALDRGGFESAWLALEPAFAACLELAWGSLGAEGLAVGSVVTDPAGAVIAAGRNRAYDASGGIDALQQTALAHAEMNALAAVPTNRDLSACTLWSTHEPCSMCAAAISFLGIKSVRFLSPDPAYVNTTNRRADAVSVTGAGESWSIAASVLFLVSVIRLRGPESTTMARNRVTDPEPVQLAADPAAGGVLGDAARRGDRLKESLEPIWLRIVAASGRRGGLT